jgi:hypothetical protein
MKFTAVLVALTAIAAVAIGPGITLVRCLLTGQVQLTCCCIHDDDGAPAELLEATDDCCQFVHLDASWQRSSSPPSSVELLAPNAPLIPSPWPGGSSSAQLISAAAAPEDPSPPPLWLSTQSLRI